MPILIAALGIVVTALFYIRQARRAASVAQDVADAVADLSRAPRRMRFRRKAIAHPVEQVDDVRAAIAALAAAHLEAEGTPTQERLDALTHQIAIRLKVCTDPAAELMVHGRWLVSECGTPAAAITRLGRRARKLGGPGALILAKAIAQEAGA